MLAESSDKGDAASWLIEELIIFGGSGFDYQSDIEINLDGNIFVAGLTGSTDLPGTADDPDERLSEDMDGFVTSFEPIDSQAATSKGMGGLQGSFNVQPDGPGKTHLEPPLRSERHPGLERVPGASRRCHGIGRRTTFRPAR